MTEIAHEQKRRYTRVVGSAYSLPHDDDEGKRLALQHNLLLRTWDNKALHAPVFLTGNDFVLDSGTGTGIWLRDLARETAAKPRYIGIDMESSLFPDSKTLALNMSFEKHSVTDLPEGWTEKFTVVHQRLLIAGLRGEEWQQAIREMYRVLKPGGWVQLFEFKTWVAGPNLAKHLELLYRRSDEQGTMWRDITARIPDFLERSGFVNVHHENRKTPFGSWAGRDGIDGRKNMMGLLRGFKTPMLKGGGYGIVKTESEYDELVEQIKMEMENTPGAGTTWTMFLAQKPRLIDGYRWTLATTLQY